MEQNEFDDIVGTEVIVCNENDVRLMNIHPQHLPRHWLTLADEDKQQYLDYIEYAQCWAQLYRKIISEPGDQWDELRIDKLINLEDAFSWLKQIYSR